jgi:AcrR family transcriptional regulator
MTYREADNLRQARGLPNKPHRRARRKPAESREQLLRAATKEFVTHGFAGARVNRIVSRARSNPRMLYHYFGSKSQLYVAVLEEALAGLRRQELEVDVEHLDAREGLLRLFEFMRTYSSITGNWYCCYLRRTCLKPNTCANRRVFRKCHRPCSR